ncbi:MAG: hypothetical protein R3A47_11995 [Polyangiales bacterium]
MPFLILCVFSMFGGLLAGSQCADFHRTQSVPLKGAPTVWSVILFSALPLFGCTAYFYFFYGDWMLSYAADASTLALWLQLVLLVLPSLCCVAGFTHLVCAAHASVIPAWRFSQSSLRRFFYSSSVGGERFWSDHVKGSTARLGWCRFFKVRRSYRSS